MPPGALATPTPLLRLPWRPDDSLLIRQCQVSTQYSTVKPGSNVECADCQDVHYRQHLTGRKQTRTSAVTPFVVTGYKFTLITVRELEAGIAEDPPCDLLRVTVDCGVNVKGDSDRYRRSILSKLTRWSNGRPFFFRMYLLFGQTTRSFCCFTLLLCTAFRTLTVGRKARLS